MRFVYAFDPGKMTGWAVLNPGGGFSSGEQPWYDALFFMDELLRTVPNTIEAVVCEDFIYTAATAQKSRQTWSTEGIGVLRYLTRRAGVDFILQTPASAKRFSTDEKLRRIGWWNPGHGHANDAARHLLVYAVSNGRAPMDWFRSEED